MKVAEKLNRFNAYVGEVKADAKLAGVTDEVELPDFQFMSETLSLAGMAGEIDSPSLGQIQSVQIEIPFSNVSKEMMAVMKDDSKSIILRGPQEVLDTETHARSMVQREVVIKGLTKGYKSGRLKKGGYGNPSITKEVTYFQDTVGTDVVTLIDKWNGKVIIDGQDLTGDVEQYL